MSFKSWIKEFLSPRGVRRQLKPRTRRLQVQQTRRQRHWFEVLEGRALLAAIIVTNTTDVTDGMPLGTTKNIAELIADPGADGTISLREAIMASNRTPGANVITFDRATSGIPIQLTEGRPLVIYNSVTIAGLGAGETTVKAADSAPIVVVETTFADPGTVTLDGLLLTGCNGGRYGAISAQFADLTVSNSTIAGNDGGGINSGGHLTVINSTISGNSALDGAGGIGSQGDLTVINSTVSGNSGYYGGISGFDVNIANSTISGNTAVRSGGGIETSHSLTISNSTITGNSANYSGAGIHVRRGTSAAISNSTISANVGFGGGIFAEDFTHLNISNSTIFGNSAGVGGFGGGIFTSGEVTVQSSIVAGNFYLEDGYGPDLYSEGASTVSNSLIGDYSGSGLEPTLDGALDLNGNIIGAPDALIDPLLGLLADNGGPTKTMALLPGSPAIDRGANPDNLASDQRGLPFVRTAGGRTDMGSYEVNDVSTPIADLHVSVTPVTPNPVLEGQEYSYRVTVINRGPQTATDVVVEDRQQNRIFAPGTLLISEQASFLVTKTAEAAGSFEDTIIALDSQLDANPADNVAHVVYDVIASQADLHLSVSQVAPNAVLEGHGYSYSITVINRGPQTATNVVVQDRQQNRIFAPGTLRTGEQASFLVTKTAAAAGTYNDTIVVVENQVDANPADNTATVSTTVLPLSAPNLQDAVTKAGLSGIPVVLSADPVQARKLIDAVNRLRIPSDPTIVTLHLTAGEFTDINASPPAGVTLAIDGTDAGSSTIRGPSPALTVASGTVIITGVTLTTATNSPTVLVSGGTLILRNDTVQESTGFNNAAIAVSGGALDLGTTASLGGNILNVNGGGKLIGNNSAGAVSAIGNGFQENGITLFSNFRVEDKIAHSLDTPGLGLVTWVVGNVFVTPNSGSVQRGIDAVASGGTVNVEAANHSLFNIGDKLVTVSYQNGPALGRVADLIHPGQVMLSVVGTAGDDTIRIRTMDDGVRVRIKTKIWATSKSAARWIFPCPELSSAD